jgi:hypothetical protein
MFLSTDNLKVILYNILHCFVNKAKFHGIEFTPCGDKLTFKKLRILGHDVFQIFRLGRLSL